MANTSPPQHHKGRWVAVLVVLSALTVLGVQGLNRYLHQPYVDFGGPKRKLRLMTWNVGKVHLRWDSRASDDDLAYVARVIREVNPHVVTLQEIRDSKQLARLVQLLGRNWRGKIPQDSYDRRAAVILRLGGRFYELPTSSGRTAQAAAIRLPNGRSVGVVSVHLDAFDAKRRLEQAEEIIAGAERLGTEDIFLLGDFNCDPAAANRDPLDQRLYRFITERYVDAAKTAGATTLDAKRLDYVFFRGQTWSSGTRVIRRRRVDSLDHHPIVAEFAFSSTSAAGKSR